LFPIRPQITYHCSQSRITIEEEVLSRTGINTRRIKTIPTFDSHQMIVVIAWDSKERIILNHPISPIECTGRIDIN